MIPAILLASFLGSSLAVSPAAAQSAPAPAVASPVPELRTHPDWPAARPADVATPRAIVEAFFSAISAAKGGTLDRTRLQSLFVPEGRIEIPLPPTPKRQTDVIFMSPDQYAAMSDSSTATSGFFDHMLALRTEQFGVIAHGWAAYESRNNQGDPHPFVRGVKSFELLNSAGRWYIVQVSWDRERPGNTIPDAYLHDSQ